MSDFLASFWATFEALAALGLLTVLIFLAIFGAQQVAASLLRTVRQRRAASVVVRRPGTHPGRRS